MRARSATPRRCARRGCRTARCCCCCTTPGSSGCRLRSHDQGTTGGGNRRRPCQGHLGETPPHPRGAWNPLQVLGSPTDCDTGQATRCPLPRYPGRLRPSQLPRARTAPGLRGQLASPLSMGARLFPPAAVLRCKWSRGLRDIPPPCFQTRGDPGLASPHKTGVLLSSCLPWCGPGPGPQAPSGQS